MNTDNLENWHTETDEFTIYYCGSDNNIFMFDAITKKHYNGLSPVGNFANGNGRIFLHLYATEELISYFNETQLTDFLNKMAKDEIDTLIADRIITERP